jgi:hypothetical protein
VKRLRLLGGALLLLTAGLCGSASAANLLVNPGFETGDLFGWAVSGSAASGVTTDGTIYSTGLQGDVPARVRTGTFAAYNLAAFLGSRNTTLSQTVTVAPNTTYRTGYYYRTPGGPVSVALELKVDGRVLLSPDHRGIDAWQEISTRFTTGPSQTAATVSYFLTGSGTLTALLCYDDFYVEPVDTVPPVITVPDNLLDRPDRDR